NDNVLLKILVYFAPLSFLTVGGGQSVVADMHRQVVVSYGWLSDTEFLNIFALSRMTPGPGTLIVTLIGWKVAGWAGALVASVAIFLPSSLLVYGLARLWARYRGAKWQKAIELGLAPVAAGMVLSTSFTLLRAAEAGMLAWIVAGATTILLTFTRVSPFLLLGGGAAIYAVFLS
ncbi:MAG: chromate transporter, partial [Hyphomicrobiales bacterium]|nr:chromate transporter [Hyphomicrobiales bacterium]